MLDTIAQWMRTEFKNVQDVRGASTEADPSVIYKAHQADLVVSTWMGARLYIYLFHEQPKLRDIKNLLKDNSRHGIGTLFFVRHDLLPSNDTIVKLLDWQEALMSLNGEFIYSYVIGETSLSLAQVHFTPAPTKDEFRCWHLPNFTIENVSVRMREVENNVRGTWHIGDIASPSYKRKMNYERAQQRFHYRTKYTQEPAHGARKYTPDDELGKCYAIMGVERTANEREVKSAFRRLALQVHPDVSALPVQEADRRFRELSDAYETIKAHHGWS